jgi:hypothetical protein
VDHAGPEGQSGSLGRLTPTDISDTLGPLLGIPELTDKLVAPRETWPAPNQGR